MDFFFSSRRRHTRLTCDWSSDVCSSDLAALDLLARPEGPVLEEFPESITDNLEPVACVLPPRFDPSLPPAVDEAKIGRASCRERVQMSLEDFIVRYKNTLCTSHNGFFC